MFNRRQFLEDSILAATAALAGPALAASAAEPRSSAANERLSVAVIGTGSRGGAHAAAFAKHKGCDLVAVCDADKSRAERTASAASGQAGPKVRAHQHLRRILDDKSIDVVSIATCNHWHALAAIWAMQAGKDVYLEKPVSHNLSEGRRIVQAARKYGRICQVGTQYRSDGSCKAAGAFLAEGKLGKVTLARSITYKRRRSIGPVVEGKAPDSVDYDLWAGPAPMSPITRQRFHYDWHWFWETGNGDIGNSDVHRADLVRFGLGVGTLPRAVMCYGGRFGYQDAAQTPNTQIAVHDYGDLTYVQEIRGLQTRRFRLQGGAIFVGTEGYVSMAAGSSALFDREGKLVRKFTGPSDNHFDNFVRAVRSRRIGDLNADILGGHLSAGLCHLGNISYLLGREASPKEILAQLASRKLHDDFRDTFERTRKHLADNGVDIAKTQLTLGPRLTFDPVTEHFVGNAVADAMLTREHRKPFVVPAESEV
ncbi:MAG: Gfo/Idh/MocA family oxidoreductase [Phycisphaerae bacterium]|nr:Gfo/Idh/MocA family oxidoreductase [Phycisphaerae bacterium]